MPAYLWGRSREPHSISGPHHHLPRETPVNLSPAPPPSPLPSRTLHFLQPYPSHLDLSPPPEMAAISTSAAATFAPARLLPSLSPFLPSTLRLPSPRLAGSPIRLPRRPSLLAVHASASTASAARTISVGDKLPDVTLSYFDAAGEVRTVTVSELTKGKKAVLFAVPGAFTPTCSQKHLPGFVAKAADLRAKGVETIACVSVNDAFVMREWKKDLGVGDEVMLLSDGNMELTKAMGVELDLSDKPVGLGMRSRRYALLAEDGVVKVLNLEEGGAFTISSADEILKVL